MEHKERILPLAISDYRDIRRGFGIKEKNRRGHMYLIGKTGTGKSTLLANMAIADIEAGNGLAVIDPHGDLVDSILDHVPRARVDDVIYLDPSDLAYPVGLNPLERVHRDRRHLAAAGLIAVFRKLWPDFWGPRLEHILRYSLLALLERPGSTLLDLPRLLTDDAFRGAVLSQVSDGQVRVFWLTEFTRLPVRLRAEAVAPILNKVGAFLASLPLRNILGQPKSSFRLREVMDEGKILLANLAKGSVGEDCCSLLGALLVTRLQLAALSRRELPEAERRAFYLYIDEIQSFLTLAFADILSEARKYGLHLVLAHQYIEQLDERVRAAIFGNVGTLIAFRVGAEDAHYLAREFAPVFGEIDLVRLPNYRIYLKLMIDGVTSRPFSAETVGPKERETTYKGEILVASRSRYGRPRDEVERGMLREISRQKASRTRRLPI